jgi:hypothetical protein
MADIRPLKRGQKPPEAPTPSADLVRILEQALEKAKNGEISGVCLISVTENGVECEHSEIPDMFTMLGHLEYLKLLLVYGEEDDDEPN